MALTPLVFRVIQCSKCGYTGQPLQAHEGYKWWTLPLGLLMACTGIGLIPLAVLLIWLGNRTVEACPQCGVRESFATVSIAPTMESERIWSTAVGADAKRFQQNKLVLLAVVSLLLAAAIGFYFWATNTQAL